MQPPRLKNDCFALPPGVDWTPVDEALGYLKKALHPVTGIEALPLAQAAGRFLAEDAKARRAHPPAANSAVDGFGFAHASLGEGVQILPLVDGRSAAGAPFRGEVPAGSALRILTGAIVPEGVDTVVLEEDVTAKDGRIAFHGGLKFGANTRAAGEDVAAGETALRAGARLRPQELSLLAATGLTTLLVRQKLRIGVLSTGDEVVEAGTDVAAQKTYDANRPMLLSLMADWGFQAVDLGHVGDDRHALRSRLNEASQACDAILTSGGASMGDEDHVSALLSQEGTIAHWRIAIKPGRPLALGMWDQVPVFGLPGNPVAAFVCTLVFGAPALRLLAGGDWKAAQRFKVPAAFSKSKKPGRREFLRARLTPEGSAEVFASEGSGRISGLSWADGLVEIGDEAREISPGDMVDYIPFAAFAP